MSVDKVCKNCGSEMKVLRTEKVADTTYHYMRCEKCKKGVARREE